VDPARPACRFPAFSGGARYDLVVRRVLAVPLVLLAIGACGAALPGPSDPTAADGADQSSAAGEPEPSPTDGSAGEPEPAPEQPLPGGLDADAILALSAEDCLAKLEEWGVPFEAVDDAPESIATPVRFAGPVAGVTFAIPWPASKHQDVMDCRLAVAVAEWAVLLRERGVVEVRLFSFYRHGERNGVGERARGRLSQHHFGLAIDAGWLVREDGDVLDVREDFVDPGGDDTCAGEVDDERGAALLDLYCAAWAARLFHVQLSPAHNRQHANHFHLDLGGGGGGWYMD
jgi:hypothetical protein